MTDISAYIDAARKLYPPLTVWGEPWQPYPKQREILDDRNKLRAILGSRSVGKTMMLAYDIAQTALDADPGTEIIIASPSQRQSDKVMSYIQQFLAQAPKEKDNTSMIELTTGAKIIPVPNKPETIRGYHGPVYIDEADLFSDRDAVLPALLFMAAHGHPITISGTPFGRSGILHRIFSELDDGVGQLDWSRHRMHYSECPFMDTDILTSIRTILTDVAWRQEMELEFVDDSMAWLPYDLLRTCAEDYEWVTEPATIPGMTRQYAPGTAGQIIRGSDFARSTQTAVVDAVREDDTIRIVGDTAFFGVPYDTQLSWISEHSAEVSVHAYDATGVGIRLSEEIKKSTPNVWNRPVTFTAAEKAKIMAGLRMAFERRTVRIPLDDRMLMAELNSIRREQLQASVRFEGSGKHGSQPHHADRAWALALLITRAAGAKAGASTGTVMSARTHRAQDRDLAPHRSDREKW